MEPVIEGATRIFAQSGGDAAGRGPGRRDKAAPFYNPGMSLNRDLSVLLVEAFARARGREIDVADALSGAGARALRIAHEVDARLIVHANDADVRGVAATKKAAKANGIAAARLRATHGDAHVFLASRRFDVVDVDPCGSPMPFLDAAIRATRHDGLVCITATDTAALAGTYPRVCKRRYDAHHGLHAAPWRSEVGLRILTGAVVRSAARFDRVATPVLSICRNHWMRVVCQLEDGKKDADTGLQMLRNATFDVATKMPRWLEQRETTTPWGGPLWSGPLHDATLVAGMMAARTGKSLARPDETTALLGIVAAECDAPAFWIVPDALQRTLGPPPRRDDLMVRLRAAGHRAERTHLDPQGVRTDASMQDLQRAWKPK